MKKNRYLNKIASVVFATMSIFSCTEGFEELNKDPNSFNVAPPENLLTGVIKNTLDLVGGVMNDQMYNNYAAFIGGKGGQFPRFFYTESGVDGYWERFYVDILKNTQEIIDNYSDDPEYSNRVHIAKIWKSYVYSIVASTFGPVPFSDALGSETTTTYSSEEEIYTSILAMLKEAGEGINPSGDKLLQDPMFNGDNAMWVKFANTLRLEIALMISEGFPTLAQQHGSEVMANESGLISSNSENIFMKWGIEQQNWSYNYERYLFGDPSDDVLPYMNHHFILNLKTYKDPRLQVLAEPSPNPLIIRDTLFASGSNTDKIIVEYGVPYFGRPQGGTQVLGDWNLNNNDNILSGLANNTYSRPSAVLFNAEDMRFYITTFAELNFIKAEARLKGWGGSLTAEQYYYAGIDASFEQYGASGVTDYKNRDGIRWGTSSVGDRDVFGVVTSGISADPLDKIVRQRWLASFNQGHDIWSLQRRTRLLPLIAHFNPDSNLGLLFVEMPERMLYPISELGLNRAGYEAAIAVLGGNAFTSPLKINKAYTPIDWPSLDAEYNQEFVSKFYGESEDDLIAAGVAYTIIN